MPPAAEGIGYWARPRRHCGAAAAAAPTCPACCATASRAEDFRTRTDWGTLSGSPPCGGGGVGAGPGVRGWAVTEPPTAWGACQGATGVATTNLPYPRREEKWIAGAQEPFWLSFWYWDSCGVHVSRRRRAGTHLLLFIHRWPIPRSGHTHQVLSPIMSVPAAVPPPSARAGRTHPTLAAGRGNLAPGITHSARSHRMVRRVLPAATR